MTTKKINLLALAKQVEETYTDVKCSFGTIRVYHVPDALAWGVTLDRDAPELPIVEMTLATGQKQSRPAKAGDKGFEKYSHDLARYDRDLSELQSATRIINALRDIEYPPMDAPPPMAQTVLNGDWKKMHPNLQKRLWLDYTVLARRDDSNKIFNAIRQMGGIEDVTDSAVDEIKKNSA